ncbi:leptin-B-like [Poecilia formosa]|uniref:leptin b n=1 Tax=Poecilia formosa TaxID=48698 RepID=UPI0007B8AF18|nr:PREDICTED: leptin-B-like [Poecilia formosa]XP_007564153.2 PREDICTED: leptin-B-like [Poecilia formosa]
MQDQTGFMTEADYLNKICKREVLLLSFIATGGQPEVEKQSSFFKMCVPLALLFVSLMAAPECSSLPTKTDSIRSNIHNIVNIAQITLVHINKLNNKTPLQVEVSTPPMNGLTDISLYLGHLDDELQSPFTNRLSQIQADVSSLDSRVRSLALMLDCPIQDKPSVEPRELLFPDSQHYVTLAKVQHYLENLPPNKEKLKVC